MVQKGYNSISLPMRARYFVCAGFCWRLGCQDKEGADWGGLISSRNSSLWACLFAYDLDVGLGFSGHLLVHHTRD